MTGAGNRFTRAVIRTWIWPLPHHAEPNRASHTNIYLASSSDQVSGFPNRYLEMTWASSTRHMAAISPIIKYSFSLLNLS